MAFYKSQGEQATDVEQSSNPNYANLNLPALDVIDTTTQITDNLYRYGEEIIDRFTQYDEKGPYVDITRPLLAEIVRSLNDELNTVNPVVDEIIGSFGKRKFHQDFLEILIDVVGSRSGDLLSNYYSEGIMVAMVNLLGVRMLIDEAMLEHLDSLRAKIAAINEGWREQNFYEVLRDLSKDINGYGPFVDPAFTSLPMKGLARNLRSLKPMISTRVQRGDPLYGLSIVEELDIFSHYGSTASS